MGERVVLTPIIKRLARERGGCITVYEVAKELGISNREAQYRLKYLLKKGDMYRPTRGLYCLKEPTLVLREELVKGDYKPPYILRARRDE